MSVLNGEKYLRESIESILRQTFTDFEFLIIDDGSSDETPAILRAYAEADQRIRIETNPRRMGLTASLNKGLALARAPIIARQDADDVSFPIRLEVQRRILDDSPGVVLVSGRVETIDVEGKITGKVRPSRPARDTLIPWMLLFYNYLIGHSLAMFRRDVVRSIGGYDLHYTYSQDYELWLRLSRMGQIKLPEVMLLQLRMHGESISKRSRRSQRKSGMRCSQAAIELLCGKRLHRYQIRYLRSFWKGRFGSAGSPGKLHNLLKPIYEGYSLHGGIGGAAPSPQSMFEIRRLIQKQFSLWERSTPFGQAPLQRISAGSKARWWRTYSTRTPNPDAQDHVSLPDRNLDPPRD